MLRDGSYKKAETLIKDDSLMPLYRKISKKEKNITIEGYEMVLDPKEHYWRFTHVLADKYNLKNSIYSQNDGDTRHHKDFHKLNNNPDNIIRMPKQEHLLYHTKHPFKTAFRPEILEKLKKEGRVGALSTGIVFRKDEIDRKHFPAFHQIDGLYVCKKSDKVLAQKDLEDVLVDIAKSIFGQEIEYKFAVDSFPFTDPSVEMSLNFNGQWMEILGSGIVHQQVFKNLGLDPEIYNGWAFGMGIERLAMVKMGIPDIRILWSGDSRITSQFKDIDSRYEEVSKYPEISRDISFVIAKTINLNNYYEIVRDFAQNLIEEVKLIDSYEDEKKFGKDNKSYTFRIVYRSPERTLTNDEVNKIQEAIRNKTKQDLNAMLR